MNRFNNITLILMLAAMCSCAAPSQFSSDYEMTSERIKIDEGQMSAAIPVGFIAPEDNYLDQFEFWLVNKDLNTAIALNKINIDYKTVRTIYNKRLSTLLSYSKILRKAQFGKDYNLLGKDEFFNINNIECASFQLDIKESCRQRVIVFQYKNSFYELIALTSENQQSQNELNKLYNAQNTILTSIR